MSSELRVNNFKARSGLGTVAINDHGIVVTGVATATSLSGNLTGNVTGNATGLTGTPDITVNNVVAGIVTATTVQATTYVGVPEGTNVLKAMLFA